MSIEENIRVRKAEKEARDAARRDAEEIMAFIGEQPPAYWAVLGAMCHDKLPPAAFVAPGARPDPNPPLTEVGAIAFEARKMPFGKYAGTEVGQVPPDYLAWLVENDGDEFKKTLRKYLKSDRFQQRQKEE